MLQAVAVGRDVVALLLQGILQGGVALKAFTLLVNLGIQQRLLGQQQRLLSRPQRALPCPGTVQAVTDLLQLLRGGVHGVLHPLRLGLQRHQLAVVGRQIVLRGLEIVQQLRDPRLQLAQRERRQGFTRFVIVVFIAERVKPLRRLAHLIRCLGDLLAKLSGLLLDPLDLVEGIEGLRQIVNDELVLWRMVFLLI